MPPNSHRRRRLGSALVPAAATALWLAAGPAAGFSSAGSWLLQPGRIQPLTVDPVAPLVRRAEPRFRDDDGRAESRRARDVQRQHRREWLVESTERLLAAPEGALDRGKWHEAASLLAAWSAFAKRDPAAPLQMEALLRRLLVEPTAQVTVADYNRILDAWACAAMFRTHPAPRASQRAREILVSLQEEFDRHGVLQPDRESFDVVYRAACRVEGPVVARRLLALREYLHKTAKNPHAEVRIGDYSLLLKGYATHGGRSAGLHATGLLAHMKKVGIAPTTLCYNLAIKAWMVAQKGRSAAEQADRILEEIDTEPDLVTYSSVIAAWAASGMKTHAVSRVEDVLRQLQARMQPNTVVMNAVMSTWVKSRSPGAVNRTAEILALMENATDPALRPDLISYNTHLHALSLHAAWQPECAPRALQFLKMVEEGHGSGRLSFRPNIFSYNVVIEAFCQAQKPQQAYMVLRRLIESPVEPDTYSFNRVITALSRNSLPGACQSAEDLFRYMDESYRSGLHPNARPDVISYGSLLFAYSRSANSQAVWRAESLLKEMKDRYKSGEAYLKPSKICYNSLIDCWAKSGHGTFGARKAEELLNEMQTLWENGDASMAPNIITYNAVLNAWARSKTRCCAVQAEKYLNRMWELYHAGEEKVKPNDQSYNTLINAISKSMNEGKAQKALRVLRKMDLLYRAGDKDTRPDQISYTAVIDSCALPASDDPRIRRKALDTAVFTLSELQNSGYGHPTQVTYGVFLKAVANLLDKDDELRRELIERAFRQCCQDGQVGGIVLSYLRKAAPADLYDELLSDIIRSGASITVENLPAAWSCNVRKARQRKPKPRHGKKVPRRLGTSDIRLSNRNG